MVRLLAIVTVLVGFALPAAAHPYELRVPLDEGRFRLDNAMELLPESMRVIDLPVELNVRSLQGSLLIQAWNASLGDAASVVVEDDQLVFYVDPEKLPQDVDGAKKAARVFTATVTPEGTAAQNRMYGLLLPQRIDPDRPLVLLIHGLDCNRSNWVPMTQLLEREGYQVGYFTYPSDQPLADSTALLARHMAALRDVYPSVPMSVVAHSMGSLVARGYIEGDEYTGGIDRLILLAPPNQGSKWATYRVALEFEEHYLLWREQPDWQPSWIITDGLGEAGRDLKPDSEFLQKLNDRPRRANVHYTIVAGSQHPMYRLGAGWLDRSAEWTPDAVAHWWGFRHYEQAMHRGAEKLRQRESNNDGPVTIESCRLAGVDDFVTINADHTALYYPIDDQLPAAWPVIRDRLAD